jgi:hypothetical protein
MEVNTAQATFKNTGLELEAISEEDIRRVRNAVQILESVVGKRIHVLVRPIDGATQDLENQEGI